MKVRPMDTSDFESKLGKKTSESVITQSSKIDIIDDKPILVTKCLSEECTGSYTDAISESILIVCKDPKHNYPKENAGQAIKPEPAGEDGSCNPTEADLHGCAHDRDNAAS